MEKKKAVAIKYDPNDVAPRITAKGAGFVADNILKKAQASDIPIYKDKALVDELSKIDLGNSIPPELYEVIAQVLIFISDLDKRSGYEQYWENKNK